VVMWGNSIVAFPTRSWVAQKYWSKNIESKIFEQMIV